MGGKQVSHPMEMFKFLKGSPCASETESCSARNADGLVAGACPGRVGHLEGVPAQKCPTRRPEPGLARSLL